MKERIAISKRNAKGGVVAGDSSGSGETTTTTQVDLLVASAASSTISSSSKRTRSTTTAPIDIDDDKEREITLRSGAHNSTTIDNNKDHPRPREEQCCNRYCCHHHQRLWPLWWLSSMMTLMRQRSRQMILTAFVIVMFTVFLVAGWVGYYRITSSITMTTLFDDNTNHININNNRTTVKQIIPKQTKKKQMEKQTKKKQMGKQMQIPLSSSQPVPHRGTITTQFLYDIPLSSSVSDYGGSGSGGGDYGIKGGSSSSSSGSTKSSQSQLPTWIVRYVQWHQQQREEYPGMELFTNVNGPKLLIRTCLGICGGLHDRLGQLPWDLYLAAKTNRVLLLAWQRPKELEHFLIPNTVSQQQQQQQQQRGLFLDWTVPKEAHYGFHDIKTVRSTVRELFEGYPEAEPDDHFWDVQLDEALDRATSGEFSSIKILRHRLLGHLNERELEDRLSREGYYNNDKNNDVTDAGGVRHRQQQHTASDLHTAPTFGNIFHLFFRPSIAIQNEVTTVLQSSHLSLYDYTAVHCRVRHPKAHPHDGGVVKGKNARYPADKTGLPWDPGNPLRLFALETAQRALRCAVDIDSGGNRKIYFLADSNDLVRHVTEELQNTTYVDQNRYNTSLIYQPLLQTIEQVNHDHNHQNSNNDNNFDVVARDVTLETAHIDRQKGRDPPAYYATFIDLYVAMHARCVVYGVGYYAAFAAKLSGVDCTYLYAKESWGFQGGTMKNRAKLCPTSSSAAAAQ